MNRENNALFADRATREDGKPAFYRDTHGASRGIRKPDAGGNMRGSDRLASTVTANRSRSA